MFTFVLSLCAQAPIASSKQDSRGDSFLGSDRVIPVRIQVGPVEILRLKKQPGEYVPVTVRVDDESFTNAQARLKGHGSFRPITERPNLCLKLDRSSTGERPFANKRLLLNNSGQDDSLIRWKLASELFLKAGLPAARVNFARVELNGRDLGFYVLVEPTDKTFLARHFRSPSGNLYEGSNVDVADKLEQDSGDEANGQADLKMLAGACQEPNLERRWERIRAALDLDRFISFMAMEVLVCHHDGYSLDRNNYRIYHDPGTDRMVFIPHGMDLIFDQPQLPLEPDSWRGTVARAVMETVEGRRLYHQRVGELARIVYGTDALKVRSNELKNLLQSSLREAANAERKQLDAAISRLQTTLERRAAFVRQRL